MSKISLSRASCCEEASPHTGVQALKGHHCPLPPNPAAPQLRQHPLKRCRKALLFMLFGFVLQFGLAFLSNHLYFEVNHFEIELRVHLGQLHPIGEEQVSLFFVERSFCFVLFLPCHSLCEFHLKENWH